MINRDFYLNKLIRVLNVADIKIITGPRYSGKTQLLLMLKKYLDNSEDNNIIYVDLESKKYLDLTDRKKFSQYVRSKWLKDKNNILLIDEITHILDFERTLISLYEERLFSIYLTSSYKFFDTSKLATLFVGRTFSINVYTFTLKEFCTFFNIKDYQKGFDDYLNLDVFIKKHCNKTINTIDFLKSEILETNLLNDIVRQYKIRFKKAFNNLKNYLISNVSNSIDIESIKIYKNDKNLISYSTLNKYLNYLVLAFFFYKCKYYDVENKIVLKEIKYYLANFSLLSSNKYTSNLDNSTKLKNLVYLELIRRGYKVYVGKIDTREIDFVVLKNGETIYIQVVYDIENKTIRKREVSSLLSIKDSYEKIIISRTKQPVFTINGIKVIDIVEWLLQEY